MSRFVFAVVVNVFVLGFLASGAQAQDDTRPLGGLAAEGVPGIVRVFTLRHANTKEMNGVVGDLFGRADSRRPAVGPARGSGPGIRISCDPRTNSLIVIGPQDDLDVIQALLAKLDTPASKGREEVPEELNVLQLRSRVDRLEQLVERLNRANAGHARSASSFPDRSGGVSPPPWQTSRAADVGGTRVRVRARSQEGAPLEVVSVVAAGQRVKKSDLLLTIETKPLEGMVKVQEIEVQCARAALIASEVRLKSTILQRETDVAEAKQQIELAKIELTEFQEGALPLKLQVHEKEVKQAKRQLDGQKRLFESGKADANLLEEAQDKLDVAETRLEAFRKFTAPKMVRQLESAIDAAQRNLQRVRGKVEGDVKAAEADLASQRAQLELEVNRLKSLQNDVASCKILAPHDGVVAADGHLPINEGSRVREGQVVMILIPDGELATSSSLEMRATLEPLPVMRALVKLNAATAKKLEPGQSVDVSVDAFPNQVFEGTLTAILNEKDSAENAMAQILIDDTKGMTLLAGMTAVVTIELDR